MNDAELTQSSPYVNDLQSYRRIFHGILLLILVCLCYSNTLQQEWHFDDIPNIVESENIHATRLRFDELSRSFYSPTKEKILYRPVANLTFALNYLYSGLDTTSYHIVNIAIHILCAIIAYLVFEHTLALLGMKEDDSGGIGRSDIALLGAVLWALHPIQTQAVTYIVQRMASLACLFYLTAMYCYLRFRASDSLLRKIVLFLLAFVLWLAGVFSKENAALLPLALLAYEVLFYRSSWGRMKKILPFVILLFVAVSLVSFLVLRGPMIEYLSGLYKMRPFTMTERLLTEPLILTRYLFLLCIPLADFLTLESDIFASSGLFSPPSTFFALVFILALLGAALFSLKNHPLLRFAILFFFINHLVESSFIGLELYFEHRNYLPSIFLYLAAAFYFCRLIGWYRHQGRRFMVGLFVFLLTVILVSEGNATYLRNEVWETEISLLTDSIEKAPDNMRPYVSLAAKYLALERNEKARELLADAEELFEKNKDVYQRKWGGLLYYNMALLKMKESQREKAVELLLKAVDLFPDWWKGYAQLGRLFFERGDFENAEKALLAAGMVMKGREHGVVYNMYGRVLFAGQEFAKAEEVLKHGLEIEKSLPLQLNLVATYIRLGRVEQARNLFLTIGPDESSPLYLLYKVYFQTGGERKRALTGLGRLLFERQVDFCEWLNEIRRNRFPGIIYPDISGFENDLIRAYRDVCEEIAMGIRERIKKAQACVMHIEDPAGQ